LSLLDGNLVPPGMINFWPSSKPLPKGWIIMDGSRFNTSENPIMNEVLRGMRNYNVGIMPDWRGRFIHHTNGGTYNHENGGSPGEKCPQRTADSAMGIKLSPGEHQHQWVYQSGSGAGTSTGSHVLRDKNSGAGNSKSTFFTDEDVTKDGSHTHTFSQFDNVTRPDTVAGYWVMKMD